MRKVIEIYTRNRFGSKRYEYICSTKAETCKQAKERFCIRYGLSSDQVKANFKRN